MFAILVLGLSSCFLLSNFKKGSFSYSADGVSRAVPLVVPKGFNRVEQVTDAATGNQEVFYRYPGKALLYFVVAQDTSKEYQWIDYRLNVPQAIYGGRFYKGIDSSDLYWRETRAGKYRAGYVNIRRGDDWEFDSAVNYFISSMVAADPPKRRR